MAPAPLAGLLASLGGKEVAKLLATQAALDVSLRAVGKVVDKLTGAIENAFIQSIGFGERAQKSSLEFGLNFSDAQKRFAGTVESLNEEFGLNFSDTQKKFTGTVEGLRGDLDTKFMGAFLLLESGMEGNTAGVARLINQQMLTNTNYLKTAKAFAALEAIGDVQREAVNNLASDTVELAGRYRVSTDLLVGSLNSLRDSMPALGLAGMGEQLSKAMMTLQSELGPEFEKSLEAVMGMITDTSIKGYERLTLLNIGGIREALMNASPKEATALLRDALLTAGTSFEDLAKPGGPFFMLGVAGDVFGRNSIHFATLAKELRSGIREHTKQTIDFAATISTLRKEAFAPIFEALNTKFYPAFLKVTEVLSNIANKVGKEMGKWIEQLPVWRIAWTEFFIDGLEFARIGINHFQISLQHIRRSFERLQPLIVLLATSLKPIIRVLDFLVNMQGAFGDIMGARGDIWGDLKNMMGGDFDFSMSRDSIERFAKRFTSLVPLQTNEKAWGDAIVDPLIAELRAGYFLQSEGNNLLGDLNRKTPPLQDTSTFQNETALLMQRNSESLLLGRDAGMVDRMADSQDAIEGLLLQINTNLARIRDSRSSLAGRAP